MVVNLKFMYFLYDSIAAGIPLLHIMSISISLQLEKFFARFPISKLTICWPSSSILSQEGVYVPELIFGHLLTSSNYNDNEKKVTGGRNGYGAKLANIFSTEFVIETCDGARQKRYRQVGFTMIILLFVSACSVFDGLWLCLWANVLQNCAILPSSLCLFFLLKYTLDDVSNHSTPQNLPSLPTPP